MCGESKGVSQFSDNIVTHVQALRNASHSQTRPAGAGAGILLHAPRPANVCVARRWNQVAKNPVLLCGKICLLRMIEKVIPTHE